MDGLTQGWMAWVWWSLAVLLAGNLLWSSKWWWEWRHRKDVRFKLIDPATGKAPVLHPDEELVIEVYPEVLFYGADGVSEDGKPVMYVTPRPKREAPG